MSSAATSAAAAGRDTGSPSVTSRKELLLQEAAALEELARLRETNKLDAYRPYLKQLEFHAMGAEKSERLLTAGNQLGKTMCGSFEMAMHLTGRYPDWWTGHRFSGPIRAWVGGESATVVRDTTQKLLLGDMTETHELLGTGAIPADCLDIGSVSWSRGVADGVDTCVVKHISGGKSVLKFKTYEQQRVKWQGDSLHLVWFDEEPPRDLYTEGLARLTARDGISFMTFTPLKGMSKVVSTFKKELSSDRGEVIMTAADCPHITPELKEKLLSRYPRHEWDTRLNGVPMQGEGRIFNVAESVISCAPFEIPGYWKRIIGLDVGHGDHPTAAVNLALDPDRDILYVCGTYRSTATGIASHASHIRAWGRIPVAWPHDAHQGDKASGTAVSKLYEKEHCWMLPSHARFPDSRAMSVWAGITDLEDRMMTNRFKVFSTETDWFEEYRNYHMEDGKIVPIFDDLLSATRYGDMMLKFAKVIDRNWTPQAVRRKQAVAKGMDFDPFTGR